MDITISQRLKQEQEKSRLLQILNTTVHHEMLSPLKANVLLTEKILTNLTGTQDPKLIRL